MLAISACIGVMCVYQRGMACVATEDARDAFTGKESQIQRYLDGIPGNAFLDDAIGTASLSENTRDANARSWSGWYCSKITSNCLPRYLEQMEGIRPVENTGLPVEVGFSQWQDGIATAPSQQRLT